MNQFQFTKWRFFKRKAKVRTYGKIAPKTPFNRNVDRGKINPAYPIYISILALISSITSLYFSALRPPDLRLVPGEYVELMTWPDGNLVVQVNFVLTNSGT